MTPEINWPPLNGDDATVRVVPTLSTVATEPDQATDPIAASQAREVHSMILDVASSHLDVALGHLEAGAAWFGVVDGASCAELIAAVRSLAETVAYRRSIL